MATQHTDIIGDPAGLTFSDTDLLWKIEHGTSVIGSVGGVTGFDGGCKLVNDGLVFGEIYGVYFDPQKKAGELVVHNRESGEIVSRDAIYAKNFEAIDIRNDGKIIGADSGIYTSGSSDVSISNFAKIVGGSYGVLLYVDTPATEGPTIDNHGKIYSTTYAILYSNSTTVQGHLHNGEDGIIRGRVAAIYAIGSVDVENNGLIKGKVLTSGLDDKVNNKGVIDAARDDDTGVDGVLKLGAGDDTLHNKGELHGLIDSQQGCDVLHLGAHREKLLFDSALDAQTNLDKIDCFATGVDKIYLDEDIFTGIDAGVLSVDEFHLGSAASDEDDHIIFDRSSGALYYDADGSGSIEQVQFAVFTHRAKLTASDFHIGEFSF